MFPIPAAAEPLVKAFGGAFTKPTFQRFMLLVTGLIVTIGRRTVSRTLRVIEPVMGQGHWCNYHRLYSQARYRLWDVGRILVGRVIALLARRCLRSFWLPMTRWMARTASMCGPRDRIGTGVVPRENM